MNNDYLIDLGSERQPQNNAGSLDTDDDLKFNINMSGENKSEASTSLGSRAGSEVKVSQNKSAE